MIVGVQWPAVHVSSAAAVTEHSASGTGSDPAIDLMCSVSSVSLHLNCGQRFSVNSEIFMPSNLHIRDGE